METNMFARKTAIVAGLGTLFFACPFAFSQQKGCPASTRVKAVRLAQDAKKAVDGGQFEQAIKLLEDAYELCPIPELRHSLGRVQEQAGKYLEALASYSACIEEGATGEVLEDCKEGAKRMEIALASGTLKVITDAPDAKVFIDDSSEPQPVGVPLRVKAGTHQIRVEAQGRKGFKTVVDVPGGGEKVVRASLELEVPKPALLQVKTKPDVCELVIDGKPFGRVKKEPIELPPGEHQIEARAEGFVSVSSRVLLEPGKVTEVALTLSPIQVEKALVSQVRPRRALWNWVGIGLGSALIAGSVFPFVRYGLDKKEARPASAYYTGDTVSPTNAIIGGVLLGTGTVAIVTSLVLWPKSKASVSLAPYNGGAKAMLSVDW
jgi:hypothetical protein